MLERTLTWRTSSVIAFSGSGCAASAKDTSLISASGAAAGAAAAAGASGRGASREFESLLELLDGLHVRTVERGRRLVELIRPDRSRGLLGEGPGVDVESVLDVLGRRRRRGRRRGRPGRCLRRGA